MLVDLDKVQMKDTLEAIGAANEKEAHDTINLDGVGDCPELVDWSQRGVKGSRANY